MSVMQTPFKIHDENVFVPSAKSGQKLQNSVVKKGLSENVPMSTTKGLKNPLAPQSTRKALGNVSQSQINSRQANNAIVLDPVLTVEKKPKPMNPRELAHGIFMDEDPYVHCHRMVQVHKKAGTSPLDDIRANFPKDLDVSGFGEVESPFDGHSFEGLGDEPFFL